MTSLSKLEQEILQLSIEHRWRLVHSILTSIHQETTINQPSHSLIPTGAKTLAKIDPWTESLVGVIELDSENETEDLNEVYINYLEEKYH